MLHVTRLWQNYRVTQLQIRKITKTVLKLCISSVSQISCQIWPAKWKVKQKTTYRIPLMAILSVGQHHGNSKPSRRRARTLQFLASIARWLRRINLIDPYLSQALNRLIWWLQTLSHLRLGQEACSSKCKSARGTKASEMGSSLLLRRAVRTCSISQPRGICFTKWTRIIATTRS